ncbi:hypothetical protein ASD99_29460 [Mesorhizobium sp. Root695]|uniref:peroxidase family protein n=1 Tax=Mesorhizobium sp. Root695 TaxID=1736589 RepID=UPI00070DA168|nr:peroxidase family protein [Mesorhizobium sp. Root695]KRB24080.1 hypothetical protein ASD99_29460 [Mesorhizobium sp. Root695]
MAYTLKPFVINQTDIQFILDQLNFLPLFDQQGNAIINWDGTGTVYNSTHVAYANLGSVSANIAAYGTSYQSVTDLVGLRDVTGLNNNLSLINAEWGAVDQIFTRSAAADYANYSSIMQAVADYAYAAAKQYYGKYSDGSATDGTPTGTFNASGTANTDYAVTLDGTATVQPGDSHATDGTAINIPNVIDYTPRMISLATTTAGVTYDTWANHASDPAATNHTPNEIYYDPNGVATVLDWGQLATVADGGLGQVDPQARLAASAGQDDHFIGALNPGVSPSNGFFVLFGQFFDHGLDFIDKSSGATIKIALATDDPLYGMAGPDGQPVHEITISRATVQTVDGNGPEYVNHTSPFIDQSQTYGSHEQLTNLLREWVPDPTTASTTDFHAGMNLFDGTTLATAWTKADGTSTNDTLPTLDELRAHVEATGRDALTWEDVSNLRNRDASGHVIAGTSGSALLLDMNPRFDAGHLHGFYDTNGDGVQGVGEASYGNSAQSAKVDAAIATINANVKSTFGANSSFAIDPATHKLTLYMENLPLGSPPGTPHTLSGANALYPFVNFADFSITAPAGAVHDAVGEILLASVGDHYVAGDGRVNENFGLTSIHHIFHEEHNYQVQNLIDALHRQDVVSGDPTHASLHDFQIDTGQMNAAGDFVYADNSIAWDQDKVFNGAKLVVEMEYQHTAVDQYARNVTPNIQEFVGYSSSVNSAVSLEYSQAAFRFGHSTLRETIDTIDPTHGLTGKIMGYALKEAFLSPEKYADIGPAAIALGMTHQQMNEVDEFITPALNQGLLGQPLDLAAINIARGRDVGIPTLNDFREAVGLARYVSWNDFGQNMQHPTSLANFIAAYAFDGDLAKAQAILGIVDGTVAVGTLGFTLEQAYGFLNGDEAVGGAGTLGFNQIDTWLGGLAEIHQPGGLLGETFDKVFVNQIESLMDGDRFYYLFRLAGQQFAEEVGNGQFKDIVERNTGLAHLNGNIFGYADQYVDLGANKEVVATGAEALTTGNEHKYGDIAAVADGTMGVYSNGGRGNLNDGHVVTIGGVQYVQDTRLANGTQFQVNPINAAFEADSLATGTPGVIQNVLGNYTVANPSNWTITGGVGGLFAPVNSISNPAGHGGGNVVWLHSGAILSQDTGQILTAGQTFSLGLNVGDRTDLAWPGGEVRLIATDGVTTHVLNSLALPTPANGAWSHVTLDTGTIDPAYAGFHLRIEVQQNSAGGSQQILVDDIQLTTGSVVFNDGVNLDGTPNSGAESNEIIVGTMGNDLIYAQGGDDTVYGDGGNDTMYGGYGIDRLYGGDGSDHMYGGDNPDLMDGGSGDDFLYGESSGSDINGNDQVIGGSGNDFISGGIGIDKLSGGTGDDRIYGDQDTDPFTHGSDGNDYVDGGSGGDILYGDNGDDVLVGGGDQDQMFGGNGDDIIRPGDTTGALTIGTDEVLGGDGVVDEGDKPGTLGFDLIDFSDNAVRPGGVTFILADQQNPAVNVNGIPKQIAAFQTEGLIGSAGDDTLTGDSAGDAGLANAALDKGENWLVGGSGNDILTGAGGNDLIVGGSIRLDTLIGKYVDAAGHLSTYDHNNNNGGSTAALQLQDAQYQGASHRVAYTDTLSGGLLTGAGFERHFTELLRTEMFKDTVLGDGGIDGLGDTAVFTGNLSDYTLTAVDALGAVVVNPHANWASVAAIKVADHRDPLATDANGQLIPTDGTDLVIGVENFKFADQTINPATYFDKAPTLDLNYVPIARNTLDAFGSNNNAYGQNNGNVNWNGSWQESNDGNNPSSNSGQITRSTSNGGVLQFGSGDGAEITRGVGQSAATATSIAFDLQAKNGIGANETLALQYSSDGTNFVTIATYGSADATGTKTISLAGQTMTADSEIRFAVTSLNNGDYFRVDNVRVNFVGDSAQGNNNTASYTERSATGAPLTTLPHITDADDTNLQSAKIVLTDAIAGDQLNIGAVPATITAALSADKHMVTLNGAASTADYELALKAITYTNPTNQNPTVYNTDTTRHIDVTVSDGLKDSPVATTTVAITAIADPTVAGNDTIITNAGTTTFAVPDAALLANDVDSDTVLTISGTSNNSGVTSSHSNGSQSVTVNDANPLGGSFHYTVNGQSPTVTVINQNGGNIAGTSASEIIVDSDAAHTITGNGGNDFVFGNGGNDIVVTGSGNDNISGGQGNDTVAAGAGNDTVVWNANTGNNNTPTDGRDFVDGGTTSLVSGRDTGSDSFVVNGRPGSTETFAIYSNADDWDNNAANGIVSSAAHAGFAGLNANTEIVIARNGTIIVELDNIEEITVNALNTTANNGNNPNAPDSGTSGGDTIQVVGNFTATSLNYSTIHINGGDGDDTVDISGLTSDHRIVFHGAGGTNHVVGDLRPQDVVDNAAPANGNAPAGGGAPGNGGDTSQGGDDEDDDDNEHQNRAPVLNGPIVLPSLGANTPMLIAAAMLLAGASDADGDSLTVTNLTASSGSVTEGPDGWTFTPATDDTSQVSFSYDISDGHASVHQTASLDLTAAAAGESDGADAPVSGGDAHLGTDGADVMVGGPDADVLSGGQGDDVILGNSGADTLLGGAGDDLIKAGAGDDVVFGGAGNDDIFGGAGHDMIFGDGGNDRIFADEGNDVIEGGAGNDTVYAGTGDDHIIANVGDGDDVYWGEDGQDTLDYSAIGASLTIDLGNGLLHHGSVSSAQSGQDTVFGFENVIAGSGDDTIMANAAVNTMDGGLGSDTFVFASAADANGDTIVGLQPGDKIDLSMIDADTSAAGHQSFVLFAGAGFTSAGQVMVSYQTAADGEHTLVTGEINGDGAADFSIDVAGHHDLDGTSFKFA